MLSPEFKNKFLKDVELAIKRGKDIQKMKELIKLLCQGKPLEKRYDDHPLKGNYVGYRECKIEPDWMIIYKKYDTYILFLRTGTHSDLFK